MGSKTKTETVSNGTTTVAPPSWTMPGIADASGKVIDALGSLPGQKYQGPFVATPAANDLANATGAFAGAATSAQDLSKYLLGQIQTSPAEAIKAATAPVFENLTEKVLPGIKSSALASGAYSNDRANTVLPAMALADATDSANRIAAGIAENRLSQLPDMLNGVLQMQTGAGDIFSQIMAMNQAAQTAQIQQDQAANDYDWQFPFQGLDIATQLLGALSGNYGTTTTAGRSTQTQSTGGLGPIVSGLAGLAGAAASFPTGGGSTLAGSLFKKAGG